MKILKPGREQKGWATEAECTGKGNGGGGCGAQLLVEQDDLFQTSSSHHDGSVDKYMTFTCPSCGVRTDLPDGLVPVYVRSEILGRRAPQADGNTS